MGSRSAKTGKKRRKGEKSPALVTTTKAKAKDEDWGLFEILRGPLGPIVDILGPLATGRVAVSIIVILLLFIWFRGPGRQSSSVGYAGNSRPGQIAAYDEIWRREESELWDWLEQRVGVDGLMLKDRSAQRATKDVEKEAKSKLKQRQRILGGKDIDAKLREERMSEREMDEAIRVTQERLHVLKDVVDKRKSKQGVSG